MHLRADVLKPFVLSYQRPKNFSGNWFDCTKTSSHFLVQALLKLDRAGYTTSSMAMPSWVFYDCGMMPGLVAGYGIDRADADVEILDFFGNDLSFYPCSMFISIPVLGKSDTVFAHNLVSFNSVFPEKFPGLAQKSKSLGLEQTAAKVLVGASQWSSAAMFIHLKFGELELLTAETPNHGTPGTYTYQTKITDPWKYRQTNSWESQQSDPEKLLSFALKDISTFSKKLQAELEAGKRWKIVGRKDDTIFCENI